MDGGGNGGACSYTARRDLGAEGIFSPFSALASAFFCRAGDRYKLSQHTLTHGVC